MDTCSTDLIIDLIKEQTSASNLKAWKCIKAKCFSKFDGKLRNLGLKDDTVLEDIRNDALADLFQNILYGQFRGEAELSTYFIRIGMNKWFKHLRKNRLVQKKDEKNGLLTISERLQAYHHGHLNSEERRTIEKQLSADVDLQEINAIIQGEARSFSELLERELQDNLSAIPLDTLSEDAIENMVDKIKNTFPEGHHCPQTLLDYYLKYDGSYERMAHAIKRKVEEFNTVYERVKKQINRCLSKVRVKA